MTFCLHDTNVIATFAVSLNDSEQGKMPEWSIGAVSKTVVPLRAPRVRIPVFPQISLITKYLQNLNPILPPETAVILGVLLASNDTMF